MLDFRFWIATTHIRKVRQLVKENENSEFKHIKLRLKIDLVSYPARAAVLVIMVKMFQVSLFSSNKGI